MERFTYTFALIFILGAQCDNSLCQRGTSVSPREGAGGITGAPLTMQYLGPSCLLRDGATE